MDGVDRLDHDDFLTEALGRWNENSQLSRLPGEYDWNFEVSGGATGILKIMAENCDLIEVKTQVAMLNHFAHAPDLPTPHIIIDTIIGKSAQPLNLVIDCDFKSRAASPGRR